MLLPVSVYLILKFFFLLSLFPSFFCVFRSLCVAFVVLALVFLLPGLSLAAYMIAFLE